MSGITTINGIVKKIFWSDINTGQSGVILQGLDDNSKKTLINKKNKNEITVMGTFFSPKLGDKVTCEGYFSENEKYGTQFKSRLILPYNSLRNNFFQEAIRTSIFNNISKFNKEKIIKTYGDNSLGMIFSEPDKLIELGMLKVHEAKSIANKKNKIYTLYKNYCLLRGFNISSVQAESILDKFGMSSKLKTSQNPYEFLNVRGIGVAATDKVAFGIGIDKKSDIRVKSSIIDYAENSIKRGHSGFSMSDMVNTLSSKLGLSEDFIHMKFLELADSGIYNAPIGDNDIVYIYQLARQEMLCAKEIKRISNSPFKDSLGEITDLPSFLNNDQVKGIKSSVYSKVSIITGGPGVGKTTVVKNVVEEVLKVSNGAHKILMVAPTGRAARRMSQSTGKEADTIHSILEYIGDGIYSRDEKNALLCDTIVVDESSMVDLNLFSSLLRSIPSHARLIIVGDQDQLSSVGPGSVLKDLIESCVITKSTLTEPMRFKEESMINKNARRINSGYMPINKKFSDFDVVAIEDTKNASEYIEKIVKTLHFQKGIPFEDIQILSPMTNHETGIKNMNDVLKNIMNPYEQHKNISIRAYGVDFRLNERVMQTENNKEKGINNGDIGYIKDIDNDNGSIVVDFDGQNISLNISEMNNLMLAYAMTIHKSQGSEFSYVIMPISKEHKRMLTKEIVYTGTTRGKKGVFLVGNMDSLKDAVENKNSEKRISSLSYFLKKEFEGVVINNEVIKPANDLNFDDKYMTI